MAWKRLAQHTKRHLEGFFKSGSLKPPNIRSVEQSLSVPVPAPIRQALFNFTIDFELLWGNGNLGGVDHSVEKRIEAAKIQSENFFPFVEMLNSLKFPISWAIVGKLVDPHLVPEESEQFRPQWASRDWYDEQYLKVDQSLWDGTTHLDYIKSKCPDHEILSHGYAHIDYGDEGTSGEVANWDMRQGVALLRDYGFQVQGFVFPCNKHGHAAPLNELDIRIVRGVDPSWHVQSLPIQTPIGFWISPAFFSFREIKKLIDLAVQNCSFFHPWMHLVECDLRQGDVENFYKPMFSYVKELEQRSLIRNVSLKEIFTELRPSGELWS